MIRRVGFSLLLWQSFLVPATQAQTPTRTDKRPSIIFILVDDLRWNALGCMGDKIVKTPHIDKLAANGVLFKNAFVTTSICAVSRVSIMTGQWQRRHGIDNFAAGLSDMQWARSFPALLRAAGYRIGFIGKFGIGDAKQVKARAASFDFWRGLPGQGGTFFIEKNDPTRTHRTAQFGNEALEFLQGCKPGEPFCLCLSFNAPHARDGQEREFEPDPRDEKLYDGLMIPVPKLATAAAFDRLPAFVQTSEARRRWEKRFANPDMFQKTVKDYYRLITGLDREVGRIVAELDKLKLTEETIIIFMSDNGYFLGDRGLADKWFMYEESIRVPCIIFDPRLPAGKRGRAEEAMALNVDLAPTILEWAGLPVEKTMQGRSLVPMLQEGKSPGDWRMEFFYEHHTGAKIIPPSEGVRTERFSYIRWIDRQPVLEELYDLSADALQEKNLVNDPAHAQTLAELRGKWEKWGRGLK
jgi:arylsulfatase A-like enzyme